MKILSWNILHGGGDRRAAIGSVLACHNPDVIILSEVHSDTVVEVRPLLCMQAWEYCASTASDSAVNALCVLSRTPIVPRDSCPVPPENAVRWLDVDLPTHGFGFGALHIPTTLGRREVDGGSKRVLGCSRERCGRHQQFLFIGDLNTGLRGIDETGARPSSAPRSSQ